VLNRTLADKLTITRYGPMSKLGFISNRRQRRCAGDWMARLDVRAQSPPRRSMNCPAGTSKRSPVGRLLHHDAKILLLDEPTRASMSQQMCKFTKLLGDLSARANRSSSSVPTCPIAGCCDTIGVMCRGTLSAIRPASDWNEHTLMAAAIGQAT